ncbi:hypothetical protein B1209_17130 [Raoultella planticola]|nr:hypothetical protein B1209_17130 [Raoultella planticola]
MKNNEHEDFLLAIKKGNIHTINDFLLEKYQFKIIFNCIKSNEFTESILHASNSTINHIDMILGERYFSNTSLDGKPLYQYFRDEHSFWQKVYSSIDDALEYQIGIKHHNLQRLNTSMISKIIDLLVEI